MSTDMETQGPTFDTKFSRIRYQLTSQELLLNGIDEVLIDQRPIPVLPPVDIEEDPVEGSAVGRILASLNHDVTVPEKLAYVLSDYSTPPTIGHLTMKGSRMQGWRDFLADIFRREIRAGVDLA